jgi:hypothetical protein
LKSQKAGILWQPDSHQSLVAIDFFAKDLSQYLVDQAAGGFLKFKN